MIIAALLATMAAGQDQTTGEKTIRRPNYNVLRYKEDWSILAGQDPFQATGFDALKYIALSDNGAFWVSFGGQARMRFGNWNNFGFANANDDEVFLGRLRLHADIHAGENVRIFVEGKSGLSTGRDLPGGKRGLEVDELDLQNGFVDLSMPLAKNIHFTFRAGSQ